MHVVLRSFRYLRNFEEANATATSADYCVENRSCLLSKSQDKRNI